MSQQLAIAQQGRTNASDVASTDQPQDKPFMPVSEDLVGLLVASWLAPTVKRPKKLLPVWTIAGLIQIGFISYTLAFLYSQAHFGTAKRVTRGLALVPPLG